MKSPKDIAKDADLILQAGPEGLVLTDGTMRVHGDFTHMLPRLRPGNLNREILVRAARIKGVSSSDLTAVDATAGLGDDSLLLAAAGFNVTMFERNAIIAALLRDALDRATANPELSEIATRMRLIEGESTAALPHLDFQADIVLLDPMFPEKHKGAAAKKKLQMLQKLEQPCEDERELLDAALSARPLKVIIKRPIKGPHLAGCKPSYSLEGKAIRYDVIALAR